MFEKQPQVIYEDEEVLVLDKPAGLVVNRAETVRGATVQDWVEGYLGGAKSKRIKGEDKFSTEARETFYRRSGVVHRLDKETSGVLLVAKTAASFVELQRQFKAREVNKEYLALVHGKLEPRKSKISLPIARDPIKRERFTVSYTGKPAKTNYEVMEYFSGLEAEVVKLRQIRSSLYQGFSLVALKPITGRTHQIRVHLAYLGHPLVGDRKYAGKKRRREEAKWCKRQFLHAKSLRFIHPVSGKKLVIEAPLPEDLQTVLKSVVSNQ